MARRSICRPPGVWTVGRHFAMLTVVLYRMLFLNSMTGSIKEIGKRKNAEERLRLLSLAVEQSTEGIAVANMDGNLLFVNNAFANMHGYNSENVIGKNISFGMKVMFYYLEIPNFVGLKNLKIGFKSQKLIQDLEIWFGVLYAGMVNQNCVFLKK